MKISEMEQVSIPTVPNDRESQYKKSQDFIRFGGVSVIFTMVERYWKDFYHVIGILLINDNSAPI